MEIARALTVSRMGRRRLVRSAAAAIAGLSLGAPDMLRAAAPPAPKTTPDVIVFDDQYPGLPWVAV